MIELFRNNKVFNKIEIAINGKDLYQMLQIESIDNITFEKWIFPICEEYNFTVCNDYDYLNEDGKPIELALSYEMTREICLIENSEIGKGLRAYLQELYNLDQWKRSKEAIDIKKHNEEIKKSL